MIYPKSVRCKNCKQLNKQIYLKGGVRYTGFVCLKDPRQVHKATPTISARRKQKDLPEHCIYKKPDGNNRISKREQDARMFFGAQTIS